MGERQPVRRHASTVLVAAAACALVLAVVAGYAKHAVLNPGQFANRAAATLRDDSVKSLIAERITDDVVLRRDPDLLAARPLIESIAGEIVGSGAFARLFTAAVRDAHRAVIERDQDTLTLTVLDVGTVLSAALERLRPSLAEKLARDRSVELIERRVGAVAGDLTRLADRVRPLPWLFGALTLLLAAAAVALAPDRRRAVWKLGVGAAAGGVAIVVAYALARSSIVGSVQGADPRAAAGAVWDAFLADLRSTGWVVAASGAVVAAAAASVIRPVRLERPLVAAWQVVAAEPERTWLRVVRAVALIAIGLLVALQPATAVQLAVTVIGVLIVSKGVESLLRLVYRPPVETEQPERAARGLGRLVVVGVIAVLAVAALAVAFAGSDAVSEEAPPISTCNGHVELCERPFDEVALAATHNSMSAPLPGWFSAEQEQGIGGQLTDGIRGLLFDTHYGDRLPNGRVRTFFGSRAELRRQAARDGVGPKAVDAALRIRERLGFAGEGKRGMYLCHTFCELGATPVANGLGAIREFLVTHPADVVVVVNQDAVTPEDFVAAVEAAGLARYAYRGPTGEEWPTLREMIESDQRLVLLAEQRAGAAPWYHLAYESITQETPYTFPSAAALVGERELARTCTPNRGPASAPLFLLNHWVSTDPLPQPTDASRVNARAALLARARACERIRQRLPNLVAVNFYRRGDVFGVVDELNGVAQP
jgi:hypothetical protein